MDSLALFHLCEVTVSAYYHEFSSLKNLYSPSDLVSELYIKLNSYPSYQNPAGAVQCFRSVCLNLIRHLSHDAMSPAEISEVQSWWEYSSLASQYEDQDIAEALKDLSNRSLATIYRYVTGKDSASVPDYLRTLIINEFVLRHSR